MFVIDFDGLLTGVRKKLLNCF